MSVKFHLPYSEKKINDFKFLGKKIAAAKVLLTMEPNVRALFYADATRRDLHWAIFIDQSDWRINMIDFTRCFFRRQTSGCDRD